MKWFAVFLVLFELACSNTGKNSPAPVVCPIDFDDLALSVAKETIVGNWKLVRASSEDTSQSVSLTYQFSDRLRILQSGNLISESEFQIEVDLGSPVQNQLKLTYLDDKGVTQIRRIFFGNQSNCMMIQQVSVGKVESLYFQRTS
jgi:hypothetical protein